MEFFFFLLFSFRKCVRVSSMWLIYVVIYEDLKQTSCVKMGFFFKVGPPYVPLCELYTIQLMNKAFPSKY